MSGLDFVIAAVFLVSIVVGLVRGFVREVLSILSWIAAFWFAITFCEQAGDYLTNYVSLPAESFRIAAGFAVIFIGTLFLFSIISYLINKLLVREAVKGTDRVLGIVFGAIRAVAIMAVFIVAARGLGLSDSGWWAESNYIGYFDSSANFLEDILPEQLKGFKADEVAPSEVETSTESESISTESLINEENVLPE